MDYRIKNEKVELLTIAILLILKIIIDGTEAPPSKRRMPESLGRLRRRLTGANWLERTRGKPSQGF